MRRPIPGPSSRRRRRRDPDPNLTSGYYANIHLPSPFYPLGKELLLLLARKKPQPFRLKWAARGGGGEYKIRDQWRSEARRGELPREVSEAARANRPRCPPRRDRADARTARQRRLPSSDTHAPELSFRRASATAVGVVCRLWRPAMRSEHRQKRGGGGAGARSWPGPLGRRRVRDKRGGGEGGEMRRRETRGFKKWEGTARGAAWWGGAGAGSSCGARQRPHLAVKKEWLCRAGRRGRLREGAGTGGARGRDGDAVCRAVPAR
jgi:hypothetical protein